jgi:membrane protein
LKLTQIEWPVVAKSVANEYKRDDVGGLAAEMAYHFIFALFPFVIFLATVAGMVGRALRQDQLLDDLMNSLYSQMPAATAEALREPLEQVLGQRGNEALSIGAAVGLVLALWSASAGVATIMKAFNRAYGVAETRGFIKSKAIALGLTVLLSLLLIVGVVSLTVGDNLIKWVGASAGLGGATQLLLQVVRVVVALLGITIAFSVLYWQAPNVRQQYRWITPGTLLATAALILLSLGFGLYVNLVGAASYAKTYGTAFGLILFLYFLYLSSQVIVLGAEFNAETTKRYDPETIRDKITDPRKQLPGKQPEPHPQAAREAGVTAKQMADTNDAATARLAAGEGGPETATFGGAAASSPPDDARQNGAARTDGDTPPDDAGTNPNPEIKAPDKHRGPDRTQLAALAVAGAAVAGAVALGVARRDQEADRS